MFARQLPAELRRRPAARVGDGEGGVLAARGGGHPDARGGEVTVQGGAQHRSAGGGT